MGAPDNRVIESVYGMQFKSVENQTVATMELRKLCVLPILGHSMILLQITLQQLLILMVMLKNTLRDEKKNSRKIAKMPLSWVPDLLTSQYL
jgi:hypothetical protein